MTPSIFSLSLFLKHSAFSPRKERNDSLIPSSAVPSPMGTTAICSSAMPRVIWMYVKISMMHQSRVVYDGPAMTSIPLHPERKTGRHARAASMSF